MVDNDKRTHKGVKGRAGSKALQLAPRELHVRQNVGVSIYRGGCGFARQPHQVGEIGYMETAKKLAVRGLSSELTSRAYSSD
jgi:hypothetical protein